MQVFVERVRSRASVVPPPLRLALLSGDWIPLSLPDELRDVWPAARVIALGGATEAGIWSVVHEIEAVDPSWGSVPYGVPLRNQEAYVLGPGLELCPPSVVGELYLGGASLAVGYLDDDERTRARFVVHPRGGQRLYRTGDLACHERSGRLRLVGRTDFQSRSTGTASARRPGGRAAQAAAVDESSRTPCPAGAPLIAFVRWRGAGPPRSSSRTLAISSRRTSPQRVVVVDAWPRTSHGKIDRPALRRRATATVSPPRAARARARGPRWSGSLRLGRGGRRRRPTFFECGRRRSRCPSPRAPRAGAGARAPGAGAHLGHRGRARGAIDALIAEPATAPVPA